MSFAVLIDNLSAPDVSYGHIHCLKIDLLRLLLFHLYLYHDVRLVFSLALVLQPSTPLLVLRLIRRLHLQLLLHDVSLPLQYGSGHH